VLPIRSGCATDVGRWRSQNQDSLYAADGLYLVADGMGGQPAGDVASKLAVAELTGGLAGEPPTPAAVQQALARANQRLLDEGAQHPDRAGLGSTVTGLVALAGGRWAVLNLGDSRVYRYADGALGQLTVDHSAVQELVDAGLLDPVAARHHPRRNVVTRSLGVEPASKPDVWLRDPVPGERFLLCSDGLTNELADPELAELLGSIEDPQQAADQLVRRAVQAGGRDNVTVIVVDVPADPEP